MAATVEEQEAAEWAALVPSLLRALGQDEAAAALSFLPFASIVDALGKLRSESRAYPEGHSGVVVDPELVEFVD